MEYSLLATLVLTIVLSFILSFTVFFDNHVSFYFSIFDFLAMFLGLIFYVGLVSLIITLVSAGVIGAPTVYILKHLELAKPMYASLVGGICVYFVMLVSEGRPEWYFLFFSFYGFVCGYAFMYGYQKEDKL